MRVVQRIEVVAGVGKSHVDFDKEVSCEVESLVGDIGLIADESETVSVEGKVEDEPHALENGQ